MVICILDGQTKEINFMAVVLTEADLSAVEKQKRREQVEKNRAIVKSRDKQVILGGIEIPVESGEYPIEDVILYSSKVEPENRMLGHHYECIITFRGVEFYSMEQLFSSLKFNERPYILEDIMTAPDGVTAKKRSHVYMKQYLYDSDFNLKSARLNAMCFLFKYLSVPEYRNRLRELRGRILFENKGEYEGGNRMDPTKKKLLGFNTDGKAMMAVRDMMLKYEDEAITAAETDKGGALTDKEREDVLQGVLDAVREKFENDKTVKADSDNVINYIYEHTDTIPLKRYWPKPGTKAILVEFDNCVFDTSVDDNVRKTARVSYWPTFYGEYIPQYKLYDGWKELFEWAKENEIMIGVLGKAKADLVRKTFETYGLPCDAVVYAGRPGRQHGYDLIDYLKIRPDQVLCYVSGSAAGLKQAKENGFRFIAATWGAQSSEIFGGTETISSPVELKKLIAES